MSLREEAERRAAALNSQDLSSDNEESIMFQPPALPPPAVAQQPQRLPPSTDLSTAARREWKSHGSAKTQALEEKRNAPSRNPNHLSVKVFTAQTRNDLSGSPYTAYLINVVRSNNQEWQVEHRYSDFDRLHKILRQHGVELEASFPGKDLSGRLGTWTPSITWFPEKHSNLVAYRVIELDRWLVYLVEQYNKQALPGSCTKALSEFLSQGEKRPCERDNSMDDAKWKWNNPMSFTLGSAIRQATLTVDQMCRRGVTETDTSIPLDLLQQAKGLVFMTVLKGGVVVSGRFGTGLVITRMSNGWSAPVAIGTVGVGWGALIGGDVTHYLIVLTTSKAVEDFCTSNSVQLGAELGIAVGPVGRGANSHLRSGDWTLHPAYAYAHSQGFFVGISLEGSVCKVRHDINTTFYGCNVQPRDLLQQMGPKAAEPLYHALNEALKLPVREGAFRPSTLFSSRPRVDSPPQTQQVVYQPNLIQSSYTVQPPHESLYQQTASSGN